MKPIFDDIELLFRRAMEGVSQPENYFSSEDYVTLRIRTAEAFRQFVVPLEMFFDVVRGVDDGSQFGHSGGGRALSFPSRFLRVSSTKELPIPLPEKVDQLTRSVFFLGLLTHFFLTTFPTRQAIDRVQLDHLLREWFLSSLIADSNMKQYSKGLNDLPERLYKWYFVAYVEPALRTHFGFGFLKLGRARAFFRNLYFGGARLGMLSDLVKTDVP
jgi:hypothetical protein